MSTLIYIPKRYSISDQAPLVDTISSPLTYKSEQVNATLNPSASGFMCAYGEGSNLLDGGVTSPVSEKLNAWVSDNVTSTARLSGRVIHFAPCTRYEFDGLEKSSWTPDVFNEDVTYHNNMSSTGQFIGRSIVRASKTVAINPISFNAPISRLAEVQAMIKAMRAAPFYVKVCAPYAEYVTYGWTEKEPKIQYLDDFGQMTISFSMRSTA